MSVSSYAIEWILVVLRREAERERDRFPNNLMPSGFGFFQSFFFFFYIHIIFTP